MSKLPKGHAQVGRLALRQEGALWCAYFAPPDTMVGAQLLGTVILHAAEDPEVRRLFMATMRAVVNVVMREALGQTPSWTEPQAAPESERGGHG
jgi:hypothetical protein